MSAEPTAADEQDGDLAGYDVLVREMIARLRRDEATHREKRYLLVSDQRVGAGYVEAHSRGLAVMLDLARTALEEGDEARAVAILRGDIP
jgi:hypothetical protein